jgi:HK97 family phage major capsid protein
MVADAAGHRRSRRNQIMATDFTARVAQLSDALRHARTREEMERVRADLTAALKDAPTDRKAQFAEDDADVHQPTRVARPALSTITERASRNDEEAEAYRLHDELTLLSIITKREPQRLRAFADAKEQSPWLARAMDTSAGSAWVPTELSQDFVKKVRLELRVAALLNQVTMPTATYDVPVQGSDMKAYMIGEQGDADADLDTNKRIKSTSTTFGKMTLSAKKTGARVTCSSELTEDTAPAMLPYLLDELARAQAEGAEDACVNGKVGGSHLDSDVTQSDDPRKGWFNGFRSLASGASFGNNKAVTACTQAGSLDISDLRRLREKMGKHAVRPEDCAIITGVKGFNRLLTLRDGNNSPTLTLDKFGPNATILTGQLAAVDGMPVIISPFVREDLNHAAGVYDGVTTDSTLILMINRRSFFFGNYRTPTIKTKDVVETDQFVLVTTARGDMKAAYPTETVCGYLYDCREPCRSILNSTCSPLPASRRWASPSTRSGSVICRSRFASVTGGFGSGAKSNISSPRSLLRVTPTSCAGLTWPRGWVRPWQRSTSTSRTAICRRRSIETAKATGARRRSRDTSRRCRESEGLAPMAREIWESTDPRDAHRPFTFHVYENASELKNNFHSVLYILAVPASGLDDAQVVERVLTTTPRGLGPHAPRHHPRRVDRPERAALRSGSRDEPAEPTAPHPARRWTVRAGRGRSLRFQGYQGTGARPSHRRHAQDRDGPHRGRRRDEWAAVARHA